MFTLAIGRNITRLFFSIILYLLVCLKAVTVDAAEVDTGLSNALFADCDATSMVGERQAYCETGQKLLEKARKALKASKRALKKEYPSTLTGKRALGQYTMTKKAAEKLQEQAVLLVNQSKSDPYDAGAEKAAKAAQAAAMDADKVLQEAESPIVPDPKYNTDHLIVTFGVAQTSPFVVDRLELPVDDVPDSAMDVGSYFIDDAGSDTVSFLEFRRRQRLVWDAARSEELKPVCKFGKVFSGKCWPAFDSDIRLGFNFGGDELSGATIAGTGDMYLSATVGLPIKMGNFGDDWYSIGPEFTTEWVTNRTNQDLHDRQFLGLGFHWGHVMNSLDLTGKGTKHTRVAEISFRVGRTRAETPTQCEHLSAAQIESSRTCVDGGRLQLGGGKSRPRVFSETGFPDFEEEYGYAADIEMLIPFGAAGQFHIRGLVISGLDPNPWSVQLGATIPVERFLGVFSAQ